jgi:protein TonB
VQVQQPTPQIISTPTPPPPYIPSPPSPPAPPPPPRLASGATPRGAPGDWFSDDYYPPAAKRAGIGGRVSVVLVVGPDGRVADCKVTASSGNSDLDETTCRLAKRFGKFKPALDENGHPIESQFRIPSVRWVIKDQ